MKKNLENKFQNNPKNKISKNKQVSMERPTDTNTNQKGEEKITIIGISVSSNQNQWDQKASKDDNERK